MSPVCLPGDLVSPVAGPLLRRGCIVRGLPPPGGDTMTSQIIALFPGIDGDYWTCGPTSSQQHESMSERTQDLVLDLSDPAGMDRAARWLAAHHGLAVGATAPTWRRLDGGPLHGWELGGTAAVYGIVFESAHESDWPQTPRSVRLPGISALTNPAEALRAACLAAVGRSG